jgi:hypothetical protein
VTIAHAPTRHRHGPVAVRTRHCAVGAVVSQVARGPAGDLRVVGGEGRGGRVQLVGEGSVLQMLRWGSVVLVGRVGKFRVWMARGREGRHGSSAFAFWYRGARRYEVAEAEAVREGEESGD